MENTANITQFWSLSINEVWPSLRIAKLDSIDWQLCALIGPFTQIEAFQWSIGSQIGRWYLQSGIFGRHIITISVGYLCFPRPPVGFHLGGMEVLMMWWHSFLPSLTLSGLRRPKEIKLQNIDDPTIPNTKYRDGNKYIIQITGLATNTNYRAGNKYKIQSWQQNRTGSITIPWPCSLPSWAACGVPLTSLPKQSAKSILQFTSTFEEKKLFKPQ